MHNWFQSYGIVEVSEPFYRQKTSSYFSGCVCCSRKDEEQEEDEEEEDEEEEDEEEEHCLISTSGEQEQGGGINSIMITRSPQPLMYKYSWSSEYIQIFVHPILKNQIGLF